MLIYVYLDAFTRLPETETVFRLRRHEGRDMEHLACATLAVPVHGRAALRQQVVVQAAEGVAHLADDGPQAAVGVMAVPQAQGIEAVTQDAREAEQEDLAAVELDAAHPEHR